MSRHHAPAPKGARCALPPERCTSPGQAQHHAVLSRGPDGHYVEPIVLIPLCQPGCHQLGVHELLRAEGLDGPQPVTDGLLLARVAANLAYLGGDRRGEVVLPATVFRGLAGFLWPLARRLRAEEASRG
jgi:hypothetical protein